MHERIMGNKSSSSLVRVKSRRKSMKSRTISPEHSSLQNLDEVRRSLEPNIGDEIKDCTALFDFPGYHECDLAFKRGDMFHHVRALKDRHDWLLATHIESRERGFIPRDYVALDSVPDYYRNFSKAERETLLLNKDVPVGSYIIKETTDGFLLDVKQGASGCPEGKCVSYRIKHWRNSRVYITPRKMFDTVTLLIQYYKENESLCCRLQDCIPPPQCVVAGRDLDIRENSLQLEHRLGKGGFGDVFSGILNTSVPVAVKMVEMALLDITPQQLAEEVKKIAPTFRHHRFVQTIGVCTRKVDMLLIMELVSRGSLRDLLREDQGQTIHFLQCVDIAHQVCEGMVYLGTKEETFRCLLMCDDILVEDQFQIKIQIFPLATDPHLKDKHFTHNMKWRAPEYMINEELSPLSDVWSFGVLMFEIISFGKRPFTEVEPREFITTVYKAGYKMAIPSSPITYDKEFWCDVMFKCLELEPEIRPSFTKLVERFKNELSKLGDIPMFS